MNRHNGRHIDGLEHLRQSVSDILSTPIGSRVMRRDYGSLVPALLDQPDNEATQVRLQAAVAGALMRWEPRMRLARITIQRDPATPGRANLTLTGSINNTRRPAPLSLQLPITRLSASATPSAP
jgi:phage baseplate assembly protein W